MGNFGFLAAGPKCRDPHRGNLRCPGKCLPSVDKSLSRRHPIRGRLDTPTPPNIPLDAERDGAAQRRGRAERARRPQVGGLRGAGGRGPRGGSVPAPRRCRRGAVRRGRAARTPASRTAPERAVVVGCDGGFGRGDSSHVFSCYLYHKFLYFVWSRKLFDIFENVEGCRRQHASAVGRLFTFGSSVNRC